jgi:kinesin family protein 6/9
MGVGRTQIMNILKRKSETLDDFKNNMPGSRKRQRRVTGNEDINQLCWNWFQEISNNPRVLPVLQVIYYSQNVK